MYQLYLIHSGNEGYDPALKNAASAYVYIMRSLSYGINSFDEAAKYFNDNYNDLAPIYVFSKGLGDTI